MSSAARRASLRAVASHPQLHTPSQATAVSRRARYNSTSLRMMLFAVARSCCYWLLVAQFPCFCPTLSQISVLACWSICFTNAWLDDLLLACCGPRAHRRFKGARRSHCHVNAVKLAYFGDTRPLLQRGVPACDPGHDRFRRGHAGLRSYVLRGRCRGSGILDRTGPGSTGAANVTQKTL